MIPGGLAMMAVAGGIVSTDSFNRSNGALAGSTLDNANGGIEANTWTTYGTGTDFSVISNQAGRSAPTGERTAVVGSTPAVDVQRVSIVSQAADSGPTARWATAATLGSFYLYYRNGVNAGLLYKFDGTTFTQLGSNGPTAISNGDTMAVYCNGTSIQALLNGAVEVSVTDSTYATGKPGTYAGGGSVATMDNFKYEVE